MDEEAVDDAGAVGVGADDAGEAAGGLRLAGGHDAAHLQPAHRADVADPLGAESAGDLEEHVVGVRVAGVVERGVAHRVPHLRRQRGAADPGGLGADVHERPTAAQQLLAPLEAVDGVLELGGDVDPVQHHRAVEVLALLGARDDDAGRVRRGAAVGGPGCAGDEPLLLGVAERLQLVPGVPQRVPLQAGGRLAQRRQRHPVSRWLRARRPARARRQQRRQREQHEGQQGDEESPEHGGVTTVT